jgi:hypothetical protein
MKAPTSKLQAPEKFQTPSSKTTGGFLEFEAWCFSGAWMLVLGASEETP